MRLCSLLEVLHSLVQMSTALHRYALVLHWYCIALQSYALPWTAYALPSSGKWSLLFLAMVLSSFPFLPLLFSCLLFSGSVSSKKYPSLFGCTTMSTLLRGMFQEEFLQILSLPLAVCFWTQCFLLWLWVYQVVFPTILLPHLSHSHQWPAIAFGLLKGKICKDFTRWSGVSMDCWLSQSGTYVFFFLHSL